MRLGSQFWAAPRQEIFDWPSNFSRIGVFKRVAQQNHTRWTAPPTVRLTSFENPPQKRVCMGATLLSFRSRRTAPRPGEASAWAAAWVVTTGAGGKGKR